MLSQNFAKSIFISTPAQRSLVSTHFQVASPVLLCNVQQRQMGAKHAPKFEKGKIKFKHNEKMKKLKDMSDSARKEYEKMRQKTRQILWEPKTDVEAMYKQYMLDIQFNPRKPYTDRIVYEMLEKVQSEQDFSLALRIWRVLLYRNVDITVRTSQKIADTFITLMKDYKSVVEIVRNAKTLNMTFSRDHVHQLISALIANGSMDDAVAIFKSILAHEQAFLPASEDFFHVTTQFNKANDFQKTTEVYALPISGGDPATHMSKQFVPTFGEVIKACVATDNVELALRVREEALRTGVAADAPMFKDNAEFFQKASETKQ